MELLDLFRETACHTMGCDCNEQDLAIELAHFHVGRALDSADLGNWRECADQLYRAGSIGGRPYVELYRWLADQLEVPLKRVRYCWMVPRDDYYLPATGSR